MRLKHIVRAGTMAVAILLTLVTLIAMWIFMLSPIAANFMNVLLLAMILMQLLTVIVLIHIHDVLTGEYKVPRRGRI